HLDQAFVVLLGGIEVGVDQRAAIVVSPASDDFGIFACPRIQATLLLDARDSLASVDGIVGRFEMIGQGKDQMHRAAGGQVQRAPSRRWQDLSGIGEMFLETHEIWTSLAGAASPQKRHLPSCRVLPRRRRRGKPRLYGAPLS